MNGRIIHLAIMVSEIQDVKCVHLYYPKACEEVRAFKAKQPSRT